jgi:beta-1,2-mannobiose phosphorylase / 1,2-beta-oligomannan phosphorylase
VNQIAYAVLLLTTGWRQLPQEHRGIIANVVFPTGIDRRDDLGSPDRFDVYYGMADYRIGVARLDLPDFVPSAGVADASKKV